MNCVITSANIFSGQSGVTSRIFPVQLAGSVRTPTRDRPFICPILPQNFLVKLSAPPVVQLGTLLWALICSSDHFPITSGTRFHSASVTYSAVLN